jgi:hypothetical protein
MNTDKVLNEDKIVNWNMVPESFNWLAVDADGCVYAYENEPTSYHTIWNTDMDYLLVGHISLKEHDNWDEMIWERPASFEDISDKIDSLIHRQGKLLDELLEFQQQVQK